MGLPYPYRPRRSASSDAEQCGRREVVNFLSLGSAIESRIIDDGLRPRFETRQRYRKRVRLTVSDNRRIKNSQPQSVQDGIPTGTV